MAPSATHKTTSSSSSGTKIRFNSPLVIGVIVAIFVVIVALIIFIMWKRRRNMKELNELHDAVST
jgi:heme/copper-type cytochrome/quinol oxidase subunit 2